MSKESMPSHVAAFFSPITPRDEQARIMESISDSNIEIVDFLQCIENSSRCMSNILFIATGGTENLVRDFIDKGRIQSSVILLTHEGNNSLPAGLEIRSYLQMNGIKSRVVHVNLGELSDYLNIIYRFDQVLDQIRKSRLAVIGSPSTWLIASSINEELVTERWDLKVETVDLDRLIDLWKEKKDLTLQEVSLALECAASAQVNESDIHQAALMAETIQELAVKNDYEAITLECFRLFEKTGVTGCLGLSLMNNNEKLVAGCEGDVPSTFTLLVAKLLTGQQGFMANITNVNRSRNRVTLAHCTVPTRMVDSFDLKTHFETGSSIAIGGDFVSQDVTLLKIGGEGLSDHWVSNGTIIQSRYNDKSCRTQVEVEIESSVDYFLEHSIANHHILILGHHRDLITEFMEYSSMRSNHLTGG